jgi:hypothetical protein
LAAQDLSGRIRGPPAASQTVGADRALSAWGDSIPGDDPQLIAEIKVVIDDMDIEKGAGLTLDRERIPRELHFMIPYVEKWSFDSLEDQDAFVAQMQRHRPEEIAALNRAVDAADALIRAWSDTLPFDKHVSEFTPEDWQHPYWAFLNVLKLCEITGVDDDDDPEVIVARERFARERRLEQYRQATFEADKAFRQGAYAAYVSILAPFEDLLTRVQKKKLLLARRRTGG